MTFEGFPRELIEFLTELGKNNNREWFQAHRDDSENYVVEPAGLPADHARADWLRHSGLFAAADQSLPSATFSDQLPGLCFEHFQRVAPLQQWLVDLLAD